MLGQVTVPLNDPLPARLVVGALQGIGLALLAENHSMAASAATMVLLFIPLLWLIAIIPSVFGIILSGIAFGKIRRGEQEGWGLAVCGLICGIVSSLCYLVLWIVLQGTLSTAFS